MATASQWISSGLSGLGSGAAIGSSIFPGVGTAIGAGVGLLASLLGTGLSPQQNNTPYNMNPKTDQWWNSLESQGNNAENQIKSYLSQAGTYQGKSSGLLDQVSNFNSQVKYDPQAFMRQFLSTSPQLQDVANAQNGSVATEAQLRELQNQNAQSIGASLPPGMSSSGVFQKMLAEAGLQNRLNFAAQNQQLATGTYNNLASQAMGNLASSNQFLANLEYQKEQARLGALQAAAQGNMNIANQLGQQAQLYGGLLQQVRANQNQLAQPVWYDPYDTQGGNPYEVPNVLATLAPIVGNLFGQGQNQGYLNQLFSNSGIGTKGANIGNGVNDMALPLLMGPNAA